MNASRGADLIVVNYNTFAGSKSSEKKSIVVSLCIGMFFGEVYSVINKIKKSNDFLRSQLTLTVYIDCFKYNIVLSLLLGVHNPFS